VNNKDARAGLVRRYFLVEIDLGDGGLDLSGTEALTALKSVRVEG
jgi:hypothetical protein